MDDKIDWGALLTEEVTSTPAEQVVEEPQDDSIFDDFVNEDKPQDEVERPEAPVVTAEDDVEKPLSRIDVLKEYGLIEEDVDESILPDYLETKRQEEIEQAVTETLEGWKKGLSEEAAAYIQYSVNGGTFEEYLKTYSEIPLHAFDIKSEGGQESFLRYYMTKVEKRPADEAEEQIEFFKDNDRLEAASQRAYSRLSEARDNKVKEMFDAQVRAREQMEESRKQALNSLTQDLNKVEAYKDYTFTAPEKSVLSRYITRPTVKQGDRFVSQFSADLANIYSKSPEKLMLLAKLIKGDFDVSFMERAAETKAVKKASETVNKPTPKGGKVKPNISWEW